MQNGVYKHYKGGIYRFIAVATHSETGEDLVIYESLQSHDLYARPRSMFEGQVEVNGEKVPRFKRISDVPSALLHDCERVGVRLKKKPLHG